MKALTIWQPWASLVMAGFKPYEFRGWPAPRYVVGQRIVIHAGSRAIKATEVRDLIEQLASGEFCGGLKLAAVTFLEDVLMRRRQLPLAAGLGTALLGEPQQSCDLWPDQFEGLSDSDRVEHSNWAWPVSEVEPFEPIVPIKGHQGFWNWPYPVEQRAA
ncbi:MAG: ASCH domain-containing protein [Bradyrhizobium sp.]|nr:ASCH domain-containing protein [Bradyrhizobium sp.]